MSSVHLVDIGVFWFVISQLVRIWKEQKAKRDIVEDAQQLSDAEYHRRYSKFYPRVAPNGKWVMLGDDSVSNHEWHNAHAFADSPTPSFLADGSEWDRWSWCHNRLLGRGWYDMPFGDHWHWQSTNGSWEQHKRDHIDRFTDPLRPDNPLTLGSYFPYSGGSSSDSFSSSCGSSSDSFSSSCGSWSDPSSSFSSHSHF